MHLEFTFSRRDRSHSNLELTIQAQQICRLGRGQSGARPRSRFTSTQRCIDNPTPTHLQVGKGAKRSAPPL